MPRTRRLARALPPLASLAAFWLGAAWLDPALVGRSGRSSYPQPLGGHEREEILAALDVARRIYADFFASGGAPALLDEFPATKAVKHRVFRDIGFLRERGLVQVHDLATAIPVRLERTGEDTAEAVVYEEWNYLLQRGSDRAPLSEVKGMGSGFRYGMRRTPGGRWVVASWAPEDVARPDTRTGFEY